MIEDHEHTVLAVDDRDMFFKALLKPGTPTDALREAIVLSVSVRQHCKK